MTGLPYLDHDGAGRHVVERKEIPGVHRAMCDGSRPFGAEAVGSVRRSDLMATTSSSAVTRSGKDRYKWIALSNTTLGILMVTINTSILLISLPAIFRGIDLQPLAPGNTSYFLWILMGFLLVTAVLVVSFGRVGDMYGRVRMYNLGFAIFTVFSILLSVTWMTGPAGALWIIFMRSRCDRRTPHIHAQYRTLERYISGVLSTQWFINPNLC